MALFSSLQRRIHRRNLESCHEALSRCQWNGGGGSAGHHARSTLLKKGLALGVPIDGHVHVSTGGFSSMPVPALPWLLTSTYMSDEGIAVPLVQHAIDTGYTCEKHEAWAMLAHLLFSGHPDFDAFSLILGHDGFWTADSDKNRNHFRHNPHSLLGRMGRLSPSELPRWLEALSGRAPELSPSHGVCGLMESLCLMAVRLEEDESQNGASDLDPLAKAGEDVARWAAATFSRGWSWTGQNTGFLLRAPWLPAKAPSVAARVFLAPFVEFVDRHLSTLPLPCPPGHISFEEIDGGIEFDDWQRFPWLEAAGVAPGTYHVKELFSRHPFYHSCRPEVLLADRLPAGAGSRNRPRL
jgi:hypothetical protein